MKVRKYDNKMLNHENTKIRKYKFNPKVYLITKFFIFFYFLISHSIYCAFEETGSGARPSGLNNAFIALSDEPNTVFYNPAGLINFKDIGLSTNYGSLFNGLDDGSKITQSEFSTALPTERFGNYGFGFKGLSVELSGKKLYNENLIATSYATKIREDLSVGFTLKFFKIKYGEDEYTKRTFLSEKNSKTAFGGDFGFIFNLNRRFSLATTINNLGSPNIGINTSDIIPVNLKIGLAFKANHMRTVSDISIKSRYKKIFVGIERWFLNEYFALRGGVGIGNYNYRQTSLGFSFRTPKIKWGNFNVDYAFVLPLSFGKENLLHHRFTLNFYFGQPRSYEIEMPPEVFREYEEYRKITEAQTKRIEELILQQEELKNQVSRFKYSSDLIEKEKNRLIAEVERLKRPPPPLPKIRPKSYKVKPGDSLKSIAKEIYEDESKWIILYKANMDKIDKGIPRVGEVLVVP